MDSIRQYLLTITAAAIFCGVIIAIIGKKGANAAILKLLTGLFMAVTVVSPWTKFDFSNLQNFTDSISADAQSVVGQGEELAQNQMGQIITQQTQAYILDKAVALGLDLVVQVELNGDNPPVPSAVTITGAASPYARSVLCQYIESNLAIPEENQLWI